MKRTLNIWQQQRGFTLLETLVAVSIVGILALVATGIVHLNTRTYIRVMDRSILMMEARNALRVMISDFQKLSPDSVWTMQPDHLLFSDIDGDWVELEFVNSTIRRNNKVIARYVQSNPFEYLDIDKNVENDPAQLNFIRIILQLAREGETVSIEETVYVRNKSKS